MPPRLNPAIRTLLLLSSAVALMLMQTDGMYAQRAEMPKVTGINTDGVPEKWVADIVLDGDQASLYDRVGKRESLGFQLLLDGYLSAYGLKCSEYLPKDKVEWTLPTCEEEAQNRNGDYECVRRGEFHTHVWVDKNI